MTQVKLIERYDVGLGVKSRLKSMPITSQMHWNVYKDKVEESQDKSLELFDRKVEVPRVGEHSISKFSYDHARSI